MTLSHALIKCEDEGKQISSFYFLFVFSFFLSATAFQTSDCSCYDIVCDTNISRYYFKI